MFDRPLADGLKLQRSFVDRGQPVDIAHRQPLRNGGRRAGPQLFERAFNVNGHCAAHPELVNTVSAASGRRRRRTLASSDRRSRSAADSAADGWPAEFWRRCASSTHYGLRNASPRTHLISPLQGSSKLRTPATRPRVRSNAKALMSTSGMASRTRDAAARSVRPLVTTSSINTTRRRVKRRRLHSK